MKFVTLFYLFLWVVSGSILIAAEDEPAVEKDWRNIRYGHIIPDRSYSDQPYVSKTDDGAWLVTMTTAMGHEGADTQHITTQRSFDQGL